MKKLYTIIILLAATGFAVMAQPRYPKYTGNSNSYNTQTGSLRIQMFQNGKYVMRLNGKPYNFNGTFFKLDNLTPGVYSVTIDKTGNSYGKQPANVTRMYKGAVLIERGQMLTASIDNQKRVTLENGWLNGQQGNCYDGDDFYSWPGSGYGNNNNNNPYASFMADADFNALIQSVKKGRFDSDKEMIARQGIQYNNLSALQVKELVKVMDFESTRLKVAKFAFDNSQDRGRFYLVNDAFDFSSSVTELNKYMNK